MKPTFSRRYYRSFRQVAGDLRYIMSRRDLVRRSFRHDLSTQFRERLMMVVTAVNGCRYCSNYHTRESLKAGISNEELRALLAGQIPEDAPDEEIPALAYAQHWAETDADPDPEALQRVIDFYGQDRADAIHIALRMIRMGNLAGNAWDYFLYKLSFGKLGLTEAEQGQPILDELSR